MWTMPMQNQHTFQKGASLILIYHSIGVSANTRGIRRLIWETPLLILMVEAALASHVYGERKKGWLAIEKVSSDYNIMFRSSKTTMFLMEGVNGVQILRKAQRAQRLSVFIKSSAFRSYHYFTSYTNLDQNTVSEF